MRRILASVPVVSVRTAMVSAALLAGASTSLTLCLAYPALAHREPTATPPEVASLVPPLHASQAGGGGAEGQLTSFAPYRSGQGVAPAFPQPLSPSAVNRYREIFRVLREGNARKAVKLAAALGASETEADSVVLPDLLAELYLHTDADPSVAELRAWLHAYPHAPDAPAIRALLEKRAPHLARTLPAVRAHILLPGARTPAPAAARTGASQPPAALPFRSSYGGLVRNPLLDRTVSEWSSSGITGAENALRLIDATPGMTNPYAAQLYGEIALSLLSQGQVHDAFRIGMRGMKRGEQKYGFPAFIAGLAAWKTGKTDNAHALFAQAADAPVLEPGVRAGAAFWAARAARNRHVRLVWLKRAAARKGNVSADASLSDASGVEAGDGKAFYALLARHWLATETEKSPTQKFSNRLRLFRQRLIGFFRAHSSKSARPSGRGRMMGEIDLAAVSTLSEGQHFFALLQLGEQGRAEALVRRMWPDIRNDPMRARSLAVVTRTAGMSGLAAQMEAALDRLHPVQEPVSSQPQKSASNTSASNTAEDVGRREGPSLVSAQLKPQHGFRLDPALVYGVVRMESNFDTQAQSSAGARGLMQIRPQTASFIVASRITYDQHGQPVIPVVPGIEKRLTEPAYNLEVGQLYLLYLAGATGVEFAPAESVPGGSLPKTAQLRSLPPNSSLVANKPVEGDLLHVLASYNAGPGAILHWEARQDAIMDPLYFMEVLPNDETRHYVHGVLSATWRYAQEMGLDTPSLSALSQGRWPSVGAERQLGNTPS
ncbi:lytic transglycosylase domain-containing protein [Oecophyllibacter saccharovorans]|nr:lytic transglycosylase domain-containing protein [Oecophyllibacter saccharovorans]